MERDYLDVGQRPAHTRGGKREGRGRGDDLQIILQARRKKSADAVVHGIAGGENDDTLVHPVANAIDHRVEGRWPVVERSRQGRQKSKQPARSNDDISLGDQSSGAGGETIEAVFAHANERQRTVHAARSAMMALRAAAARAEPPRLPSNVANAMPRGSDTSSALDSAAPTKPTGIAMMADGSGPPRSIRSRRAKSAVGALPITTIEPARCGFQSSTAAAERVVLPVIPISRVRPSFSVQMISVLGGRLRLMMPLRTISQSVKIGR